jgi:hypothetical protein
LAPADWLHRGRQISNLDDRLEMPVSILSQAQIDAFGSALRVRLQSGEGAKDQCATCDTSPTTSVTTASS